MLNKPLDWITPCFQSLRTESAMLCKPQCCRLASPCVKSSKLLNFAIYRARIGWNATCSRLWTSSIASNTLRFHSVWISRWCLQCRGTLAPTNRIFGMAATRTSRILLQCPKRRQCEQCHETDEPTSPT